MVHHYSDILQPSDRMVGRWARIRDDARGLIHSHEDRQPFPPGRKGNPQIGIGRHRSDEGKEQNTQPEIKKNTISHVKF